MNFIQGVYVRFPYDFEFQSDPREFLMGQIVSINELKGTALVETKDPFGYKMYYEHIQDEYEIDISKLERCTSGTDVHVKYNSRDCIVLSSEMTSDKYTYYIQDVLTASVYEVSENELDIPFNCIDISPLIQFRNYEFQNPAWYIGRSIVSRSMNVLKNSISGFIDLAGCKIELLPHQLMTIMRCVQSEPCRYMLADEVGMGKTIEAIGVIKIYSNAHVNKQIVIIVPDALIEQWKNELLFKFDLSDMNKNDNHISVITINQYIKIKNRRIDFVIVDEVHNYLYNESDYQLIKDISDKCTNVLLLSATPVQEKGEQYLRLLRLLNPKRYNDTTITAFEELVKKQRIIVQKVHYAYGSLNDLIEQRDYLLDKQLDPLEDQDMKDIFEELYDLLSSLGSVLNDNRYNTILKKITIEGKNYSIARIKAILVYVSERYQIDQNVVRNRRRLLKDKIAKRELITVEHNIDGIDCVYERNVYNLLCENLNAIALDINAVERDVIPLLQSFFSSAHAFISQIDKLSDRYHFDERLYSAIDSWLKIENEIISDFITSMDETPHVSRVCEVIDLLNERIGRDKVVLFTDFDETLQLYRECLEQYFGEECVAVYSDKMNPDAREISVYKFQYLDACQFLLCDSSGGEGKNFQNAQYIVHLDLPWDAVSLEQRIGRLDRLGRNPDVPVVSLVLYDKNTVEESLFNVFDKGLNVFHQSLSGLEIVVGDLNKLLYSSLSNDIGFGLDESLNDVIDISSKMGEEIKAEQIYDVAGFEFKPLNKQVSRSIQKLYSQDSHILQSAMISWSSLTGFKDVINKDGVCSFSSSSFSYGSAIKTLLIPPKWEVYKNDERLAHMDRIRELTTDTKGSRNNHIQWIRGTFERNLAIKSDYLHFFAPGDPIFDCVVNNAINCSKGRCASMQIPCGINWQGVIFKFVNNPNYSLLYKHGITREQCNQFLGYIDTSETIVTYSIYNPDEHTNSEIIKEFNAHISPQYMYERTIAHLGKRSRGGGIIQAKRLDISNLDWFKETYKEHSWIKMIENVYPKVLEAANNVYKKNSKVKYAKDEMETLLAIKQNNNDLSQEDFDVEKVKYDLILDALSDSKVELDSIVFVWMSKNGID